MNRRLLMGALLGLIAITGLVAGSVVMVSRARSNGYACLRFNSDRIDSDWLYDLNTGYLAYDTRALDSPHSPEVIEQARSNRGDQVAFLRPERGAQPRYRLLTRPTDNGRVNYLDERPDVLTESNISHIFGIAWSPDDRWLAYAWRNTSGRSYLAYLRSDNGERIVAEIITPRTSNVMFHGWSSDSLYVALGTDEGIGRIISYWSVQNGKLKSIRFPLLTMMPLIDQVAWSPKGRWLAYIRIGQMNQLRLTVATPGDPTRANSGTELTLSLPNSSNFRMAWSPDGEHLAVRYVDQRSELRIVIYRVLRDSIEPVADFYQGSGKLSPQMAVWSPDGEILIFWRERDGGRDLAAYALKSDQITPIVSDVYTRFLNKDPLTDEDGRSVSRLALVIRGDDGYFNVDVLDIDGRNRATVVKGATEISSIFWSPDRQHVVAQWSSGQGTARQSFVTYARSDGSGAQTHAFSDATLESLTWMQDSRTLLMKTRAALITVEVLDLESGQRKTLLSSLADVQNLKEDNVTGWITFWWRLPGGESGADAYSADGARVYTFRTTTEYIADARIYPSPDLKRAVIIARMPGDTFGREMQLAIADDVPARTVLESINSNAAPRWSPDSSLIALNYSDAKNPMGKLEILTASGESYRVLDRIPINTLELTWTRCN